MRPAVLLASITLFFGCDQDLQAVQDWDGTEPRISVDDGYTADTSDFTPTNGSGHQACYLGNDRAGTTCLPVHAGVLGGYPSPLDSRYTAPTRFIDLNMTSPSLKLAPNFAIGEIAQAYKGRYGVVQPHAIASLQRVRDALGPVIVNSGYRDPAYNRAVGGATSSRHMYGDAFDMRASNATLSTLSARCRSEGADYVSVYNSHVHCDWRGKQLTPAFYPTASGGWYSSVDSEVFADLRLVHGKFVVDHEGFDEGEPLIEWFAYDDDGYLIGQGLGEPLPPADASSVEIHVGQVIVIDEPLRG